METNKIKRHVIFLSRCITSTIRVRVLLDESIILNTVSVTENEIKVNINEARKYCTEILIKVGAPEPVEGLSSVITNLEVLKNKKGKPINLKLTGKNFMMYYRFSYSNVN